VAFSKAELADRWGRGASEVNQIGRLARWHDIGKIGIPDSISLKCGLLSDAERQVMNTHGDLGNVIQQRHKIILTPGPFWESFVIRQVNKKPPWQAGWLA
jgi:HD-GYP domain-containing protein (c-di-GMP phosphodiesterase class II)